MTWIPDFSKRLYGSVRAEVEDGYEYRSVGWLGFGLLPWKKGAVDAVLLKRLLVYKEGNQIPCGLMGSHICGLCRQAHGHGAFYVPHGRCRYVMPNLITHYIKAHHYKLPYQVRVALRHWGAETPKISY